MWHAIDRFIIHFTSSACLLIAFLVLAEYLERRRILPRLAGWWAYVVPGLVLFTLTSLREAFDVWSGQPVWKVVTDWLSWLGGIGVAIWALYRIAPMLGRVNGQIRGKDDG